MSRCQLPSLLVDSSYGEIRTHAVSYKYIGAHQQSMEKRVCIIDTLISVNGVSELHS